MADTAEGFNASDPIHFYAVSRPQKATLELFEQYNLSRFDIENVTRPVLEAVHAMAPVRLARFAEGVSYDWACRLALTFLDENGIAIGKLNGAPVLFSAALPQDALRSLYDQVKRAYDLEREVPRLTADVYPAAQNNIATQSQRLAESITGPARILDLASAEAGITPYIFKCDLKGTYLKVDADRTALAVLADRCRQSPGLNFVGLSTSAERIKDQKFRQRIEENLAGKANALVCSHVLHQMGGILNELTIPDWIGHFPDVLEPGGRLLLADFTFNEKASDADVQRAIEQLYQRIDDHPELKREDFYFGGRNEYFAISQLKPLLQQCGFEEIREASCPVLEGSAHEFFVLQARLKR